MKKFWNWIHDDSGGRVLRLEGPIDNENFWGDEITPAMFREDLEAEVRCDGLDQLSGRERLCRC